MNSSQRHSQPAAAVPLAALVLASGVGVSLVGLRIYWTRDISYLLLVWNLFLAWLPLLLALRVCRQYHSTGRAGWRLLALAGLWLLFFPNAPYIFTDLVHLNSWFRRHYWLDFCLILQFALTGFLLGFVSLYLMQSVVAHRLGRVAGWLFALAVAGLAGIGVFVGRFLRWNSWSIVTHPLDLARDLGRWVVHPLAHFSSLAFAGLFAVFLFVGYVMLYALTHLQPLPGPAARVPAEPVSP